MAEIKANIGANVTGFQRGIREAIEGLNHFREHAKEVGAEVTKSIGGNDLAKMLGLAGAGGLTAAVAGFGVALVEAAKKGIEAFSEFEQLTLRIKYNLANPNLAKPIMEGIEKSSGAAGSAAERSTAYTTLLQAGIQPGAEDGKEEAEEKPKTQQMEVGGKMITVEVAAPQGHQTGAEIGAGKILAALDQWAAKNGESQSQMAETLRVIHDRGGDAGEGMTKALVSFKGLDQALAPQLAAFQAKQQPEQAAAHLEAIEKEKEYRAKHKFGAIGGFETQTELNEYTKLHKETTTKAPAATAVDMVKAHAVDFQEILRAIVAGAPKGAVEEEAGTFKGHVDNLVARFDELEKAIGAALAPDLEMLMSELTGTLPGLTAEMPKATEAVHAFAETVRGVVKDMTLDVQTLLGQKTPEQARKEDPQDPGNKSKVISFLEDFGAKLDKETFHNIGALAKGDFGDLHTILPKGGGKEGTLTAAEVLRELGKTNDLLGIQNRILDTAFGQ